MNPKQIKLLVIIAATILVVPVAAFVVGNRQELAEAFRIDKTSGKLLYFYVPC